MNVFEWLTSIIAWVQIVLSPTLFGCIVGFFIYKNYSNIYGLITGIVIALSGLIVGVIFATRVWKKRGTVEFISIVDASPELDNLEDN